MRLRCKLHRLLLGYFNFFVDTVAASVSTSPGLRQWNIDAFNIIALKIQLNQTRGFGVLGFWGFGVKEIKFLFDGIHHFVVGRT